MKKFKRALRLSLYILLILLASFGLAIAGAVPIPTIRKDEKENTKTEQIDDKTTIKNTNNELLS